MKECELWKMTRWAVRLLGCLATVALIALAMSCLLESRLSDVYGDTGMVPVIKRQLAVAMVILAALLLAAVPMTRSAMETDSWREAVSWTAASFWQGVKAGLVVFVAIAAATLLLMSLWTRGFMA